jgi:hypothetical protein
MPRIFLSHASADKAVVRRIWKALQTAGHEAWLDANEILVGESIPAALERGLRSADFVILCLSRASVDRGWVSAERDVSLMESVSKRSVRVLPVRLDDVAPPYIIGHLACVDLFPPSQFGRGIMHLLRSLDEHVVRAAATPAIVADSTQAGVRSSRRPSGVSAGTDAVSLGQTSPITNTPDSAVLRLWSVGVLAIALLAILMVIGVVMAPQSKKAILAAGLFASTVIGALLFGISVRNRQSTFRVIVASGVLALALVALAWNQLRPQPVPAVEIAEDDLTKKRQVRGRSSGAPPRFMQVEEPQVPQPSSIPPQKETPRSSPAPAASTVAPVARVSATTSRPARREPSEDAEDAEVEEIRCPRMPVDVQVALHYRERVGRCEGTTTQVRLAMGTELISFTDGRYLSDENDDFVKITWAPIEAGVLHIQGRTVFPIGPDYRMDTFVPARAGEYQWPLDVVPRFLLKNFAWRATLEAGTKEYLLPIRVGETPVGSSSHRYFLLFKTHSPAVLSSLFPMLVRPTIDATVYADSAFGKMPIWRETFSDLAGNPEWGLRVVTIPSLASPPGAHSLVLQTETGQMWVSFFLNPPVSSFQRPGGMKR